MNKERLSLKCEKSKGIYIFNDAFTAEWVFNNLDNFYVCDICYYMLNDSLNIIHESMNYFHTREEVEEEIDKHLEGLYVPFNHLKDLLNSNQLVYLVDENMSENRYHSVEQLLFSNYVSILRIYIATILDFYFEGISRDCSKIFDECKY